MSKVGIVCLMVLGWLMSCDRVSPFEDAPGTRILPTPVPSASNDVPLDPQAIQVSDDSITVTIRDPRLQTTTTRSLMYVLPLPQENYVAFELGLKKLSGQEAGMYGLICGYQDRNNFLMVGLDGHQRVYVGKVSKGVHHTYLPWQRSVFIDSSYGSETRLRIERARGSDRYCWSINGHAMPEFVDSERLTGRLGFVVGIEPGEELATKPVQVVARLISHKVSLTQARSILMGALNDQSGSLTDNEPIDLSESLRLILPVVVRDGLLSREPGGEPGRELK